MNIYICSNLSEWLNTFNQIVHEVVRENNMPISNIYTVSDAEEILDLIPQAPASSVYFLEQEFKSGAVGASIIERINQHDTTAHIILVTHNDYLFDLSPHHHKKTMNYKTTWERVKECLQSAIAYHEADTLLLHLKTKDINIAINQPSIYCIEAKRYKKITVYSKTTHSVSRLNFAYSFRKMKKMLNTSFYPCAETCIVNLSHVAHIDKKKRQVILLNGMKRPVSKYRVNKLYKQWVNFISTTQVSVHQA